MEKKIFIFRGSPASGKGTIIEEFTKKISGKVASIELDQFRWAFHLKNRSVPDVSDEEHQLAYENYLLVLENYLKKGLYTIVTEGLFSWDTPGPHGNMKDILQLCEKYGYKAFPILLSGEYDVLWQRNLNREYSVPEDEFRTLYEYVLSKQSEAEIKLDVGKLSVEESVSRLSQYL